MCLLFSAACHVAADDAIPRPEHPMPQAVRAEWVNLNGTWDFGETDAEEDARFLGEAAYPDKIVVPFCRESKLSGLARQAFVKNVWYRRSFEKPEGWKSPRVRLHIGACDWRTRVWVNGQAAGTHVGGNVAFDFEITRLLKPGKNTLIVHAYDDTASGLQALGKQSITGKGHGIFYTPTTGIWQTVWLEGVGGTFIDTYRVEPRPAEGRVDLTLGVNGAAEGMSVHAVARAASKEIGAATLPAHWRDNRLSIAIPNPRLWMPEDPFLYDLTLELRRGETVVDHVDGYFGMMRPSIAGAALLINDKPIFMRQVLDQGFYPNGIWTAPSDAELKADIERAQACGLNGARLHQKVFEPRFLYWADKLGYLVWGEFPSYGANYKKPEVNAPIINEWTEIVERDRNHPSIVGWCPFNETPAAAAEIQATVVTITRALDPARPVIETSGWTHTIRDPEVLDAHDYDQNPATYRVRWQSGPVWREGPSLPARYSARTRPDVPFFISEYGGIGWGLGEKAWGYGQAPKTLDELYARLDGLTKAMLDNPRIFGFCYTQLTNIEQEQNGLYYYDRKPKFDAAKLKAIFGAPAAYEKEPPLMSVAAAAGTWNVLVGSMHDGASARAWRYTISAPEGEWSAALYDDAAWSEGSAPFGLKGGDASEQIRTPWKSADIWLRQDFQYSGGTFETAYLVMHHDDAVEVFVNGAKAFEASGWNDGYEAFDVGKALAAALKNGENTIAVHVHQDKGGQYFDAALLVNKAD